MKDYFKKVIIFGIIFLFISTGFVPMISADTKNNFKKDLLKYKLQSPPHSLQDNGFGVFIVLGSLKEGLNSSWEHLYDYSWNVTSSALILGINFDYHKFTYIHLSKGQLFYTIGFTKPKNSLFVFLYIYYLLYSINLFVIFRKVR